MQGDEVPDLNPIQLIGLGVLVSTVVALAVLLSTRGRLTRLIHPGVTRQPADATPTGGSVVETVHQPHQTEPAPVQPAVDTEMEAHVPHHFTEDVVIPGLTETGIDVEQQDDVLGRSPEGV